MFTTEKIAVFVPIPSARAATAAIVKPGVCRNMRMECFRSLKKASMPDLDERCGKKFRYLQRRKLNSREEA